MQSLVVPEIFSYEYFQSHRYSISQKPPYECLCNNGFIKLFTLKTRVYWHAQNQFEHLVPDWKLHISVAHQDLKQAWDLLVGLFLKMQCRAGMKVIYLKQAQNPQPGREITIYIVKYSHEFQNSSFAGDFQIGLADEHSQDFWIQMVLQIQQLLKHYKIKQNGIAEGDLKLSEHISLRNQAYTPKQNQSGNEYPPNQKGWNFHKHKLPFNLNTLMSRMQQKNIIKQKQVHRPMYYFGLPLMIVSVGLFLYTKAKE